MESNWNQPQDWSKDGSVISGITGLKTGAWTALFNAKETINGKSTDIILKTFTVPEAHAGNDPKIAAERERFLVSAKLQKSLVKEGASGWVDILKICDDPPSFTMPKCGPSLEDLLDHKVALNAAELYSVLHCILQSLIELNIRHKRSHGDIKASNVLASPPGVTPHYKLADPTPKGESHSANDLYNLGLLIYRLIEHKDYDPLTQLTPSKNWSILGARRDRWIEFLHLLLSPNGCQDPLTDVKKEAFRLKPVSNWRPVAIACVGLMLIGIGVGGYHIISGRLNKPLETHTQIITTTVPANIDPELLAAFNQSRARYLDVQKKWYAQTRTLRYDHTKSFELIREGRGFVEQVNPAEPIIGYKSGVELYDDATAKFTDAIAAAEIEEQAGKALDQSSVADLQKVQQEYADLQAKWKEAAAKFEPGQNHSLSKSLAESAAIGNQPANLLDPASDPGVRRLVAEQYKAAIAKLNQALAAIPDEQAAMIAHAQARAIFQKARDEYLRSKDSWEKLQAEKKNLDLTEANKLVDEARQEFSEGFDLSDDASCRAAADKIYNASQKIEQALALAATAKPLERPRVPDPRVDIPPTTIAANTQPKPKPPTTEEATTTVAAKTATNAEIVAILVKADTALKVKNYAEAFTLYKNAAELGSAGAASNVGQFYEYGIGTAQDYAQAAVWYKKAVEHDQVPALVCLASLYQRGKGVDQNFTQALKLYKRAAELNSIDAMVPLGNLYENGQGVEQDFAEALAWYKKAAEKNIPAAITNIGVFYEKGQSVKVDYQEAAACYLKAANLKYAPAMYDLAILYDHGKYDNNKDSRPNYAEALKWFTKAAESDYAPAMSNLGTHYDTGEGVPVDHAQALKWFLKAAQGNDGMAMFNLGVLYESGRGTKADTGEAVTWFRKAAHSEDPAAQRAATEALNRLGFTP